MSEKRFNIVFKGEISPGADEATVKANVAKLFKANDKVLARLFSGEPIAIKKDVDKAGAMKYRALMKRAGAISYAQDVSEPLDASSSKPAAKAEPVSSKPQPSAPQAAKSETQKTSDVDAPEWGVAPAGSIIVEHEEVEAAEIPDISSMSMAEVGADIVENPEEMEFQEIADLDADLAPVGSDMGEENEVVPVEIPDLGGLDLAPVGADVADPVEHNDPEPPDVSSIGLAPVGADVADPEPEKAAPQVDISHIKLEDSAD
jgi:hypothetical protein